MGLFTKTRQLINYGEGLCEKAKNMQFEYAHKVTHLWRGDGPAITIERHMECDS